MRRALWLPLVALPACGLVPSEEALTPFAGSAGFAVARAVEVCLGAARVIPPPAAAGAVCVAEGAVARACAADAECAGIERCLCGRCIVEPCQGGNTCEGGRVCRDKRCTRSCTADGDCGQGEQCAAGGCARGCAADGDCHFGERCDALGDTCRAKLCSEATPCGPGTRCEAASVAGELREPEITEVGGEEVAYVELRSGPGSSAIHRAIMTTPIRWTVSPVEPVIAGAGAPSALVDGDRVELYFGRDAGISRAISTDGGYTFTVEAGALLTADLAWEAGFVGSPAVIRYLGHTYLFYEGGARAGIGLARVEGGVATRVGDAPVITPSAVADPLFWRDVSEVSAPSAVIVAGALELYFTARGVEGLDAHVGDAPLPADANDSIGLAATFDMKRFARSPTGPALGRLTNLRTYLGEREASVIVRGNGTREITFVGADASGEGLSGLVWAGAGEKK